MICLDTNYLIRGIAKGTVEAADLAAWSEIGEPLFTPMPAWFEFLCGPVTVPQAQTLRAFIREIVPFGERQAEEAARLFNAVHRKRSLRVDAMIAGTAIVAHARLATSNRADFEPFLQHGLKLV